MASEYLRLLRGRSSFEPGQDIEQVIKREFWERSRNEPDLSLSVFEVNVAEQLKRTNAELCAGNDIELPRKRAAVDMQHSTGWDAVAITSTANRLQDFKFTSGAHRELRFVSLESLQECVNGLRTAYLADVTNKDTAQYGHDRYLENDSEWLSICGLSERVQRWVTTGKP